MAIIVLDPGHGGRDPGAVGPQGLRESNTNLAVCELAAPRLESLGHRVIATRRTDVFIELSERAAIANRNGADWFLSVHCNAFEFPEANGIETYHFPGSNNGERLARLIQNALVDRLKLRSRGVKTGRFAVLQQTRMPAALAELAFISNPLEESLLQSDAFRTSCADAIAAAFGGIR